MALHGQGKLRPNSELGEFMALLRRGLQGDRRGRPFGDVGGPGSGRGFGDILPRPGGGQLSGGRLTPEMILRLQALTRARSMGSEGPSMTGRLLARTGGAGPRPQLGPGLEADTLRQALMQQFQR